MLCLDDEAISVDATVRTATWPHPYCSADFQQLSLTYIPMLCFRNGLTQLLMTYDIKWTKGWIVDILNK